MAEGVQGAGRTRPGGPGREPAADSWRWAGRLLVAGGLLAAASTVLHPVTLDPGNAAEVLDAVRRAPERWVAVHVGLGFGVAAWSLGWFLVYQGLREAGRARWSGAGAVLAAAALAVWLPLLALEAAGLPLLARATSPGASPLWFDVAWPATLAGGYVATWLYWLAGMAVAWDLASFAPAGGPRVSRGIALATLLPGLPGMVLAWLFPDAAVPVLMVSLVPGALWALVVAWRLARGAVGNQS
ncbi:hypothetical protein DYI95_010000 [Thermaerobacter sp. PB12/4term]|uniref:hypothetical protein n=1 Tax=Thermaerobacter sp. PB12/4term TaxID=2293838 RepID=UPI000E3282E1|nr:hypothetical protein [Thermaerobacter sp. PB12/4term]QIA27797.1 hypothetical protein DYI95_010000 [Thermaerobacter sp. PB12/4term]